MTPTPVVDELSGYLPNQDEKTWAMIAHLSGIFSGFLIPLLVLLTKGKDSAWVRKQTVEALNFHLVVFIGYVISGVLMIVLVGFCTFFALMLFNFIFAIIAAVKTYNGEHYRYPVTIRFLT
jgi:uncharacterized Tic20 family protein